MSNNPSSDRIVVVGGGTGGHITPVLAVADAIKKADPSIQVTYVGLTNDSLNDLPSQHDSIDNMATVRAGKFRRYHGESLLRQLLDIKTIALNLRDFVFMLVGVVQGIRLLKRLKPSVIFTRGSYVSVPVCWAAALLKIPYITHDSDALPSLANRLIAPWAKAHAVALPKDVYQYPEAKTITVGVPISHRFKPVVPQEVSSLKHQLELDNFGQIVLFTGGGTGALRVNNAVIRCAGELLDRYPNLGIVHLTGRQHESEVRKTYKAALTARQNERVIIKGFVTNLHAYSAVANVVVTRAGATAVAEFAAQAKACVVIPSPFLAGGHQLKNAQVLQDRKAIKMVSEATLAQDPKALLPPLVQLLDNPERAKALGIKLLSLAHPQASQEIVRLLLSIIPSRGQR